MKTNNMPKEPKMGSEMQRERTYTFRHWRKVECLPDSVSQEALKEEIIRRSLVGGYIPAYFNYEKYPDLDRLSCVCAYAGKKTARIIYEKNKESLQTRPNTFPISKGKRK